MRNIAARKTVLALATIGVAAAPIAAFAQGAGGQAPADDMKAGRIQAQSDGMRGEGMQRPATRGERMRAADAQSSGVRTGTLECDVAGGAGFIIGSKRDVACTYKARGMKPQRYVGSIGKLGLDVGVTSKSVMVWQVVAPSGEARGQTLDGKYRGVSAGAAVAAGASANVLVASDTGFNLQPVSVSGERGLNLAAGVGTLSLRSADRG